MSKEEIETLAKLKYPINVGMLYFEENEQYAKQIAFSEGYLLGHTTALDEAAEKAIYTHRDKALGGFNFVATKDSITNLKIKE